MNAIILFIACTAMLVQAKDKLRYCDIPSNDPNKQCYVKEILLSIAHSPNQLAFDGHTNSLHFSFDIGQGEYIPAIFRLDTKKLTVLRGVKDAFAMATDQETGDTYFGGSHGIYKYNSMNKNLKKLNKHLDIWWLFVTKTIYFIRFPNLNACYYKNRTVRELPELQNKVVHQFVLDKARNVYFINSTGFYGVKRGEKQAVLFRNHPKFQGMAADNNGYVHVSSEDGIYAVSKMVRKVKKIADIQGVLGITFDKQNNIIYSDSHELVRLVPLI